jgi:hypothetical protein
MNHWIKTQIKRAVFSVIKPPVRYLRSCYAQAGEDSIVSFLFAGRKLDKPSYLDLGVFLPDEHNNTYLFYTRGCRGVLVEADRDAIDRIRAVRPEDKILNVGVGITDDASADFYVFDDAALNTFNREEAESRQSRGSVKVVKVLKTPLKTINTLIAENFERYPDFLSIDLEGFDLAVLRTLDLDRYPIPVICAETCTYSENHVKPKDPSIADFMLQKNYFIYADTYINTIFVNKAWFYAQ